MAGSTEILRLSTHRLDQLRALAAARSTTMANLIETAIILPAIVSGELPDSTPGVELIPQSGSVIMRMGKLGAELSQTEAQAVADALEKPSSRTMLTTSKGDVIETVRIARSASVTIHGHGGAKVEQGFTLSVASDLARQIRSATA